MKRYEQAVTEFFPVGFDLKRAAPSRPTDDASWQLCSVVWPTDGQVMATAYWQREVEGK